MKHSIKVVIILLGLFLITQLIGIAVITVYSPEIVEFHTQNGTISNITVYNLPYGAEPPQGTEPSYNLLSIIIAMILGVGLILLLMKLKIESFIRWWFFFVVVLALSITLNAFLISIENAALLAFLIALPLAIFKVFKRNIIIHNLTELLIYPGMAALFVPWFNLFTVVLFLIFISAYDMYAVWHAGFMQKMAKYQIQKVKIFSGLLIPYLKKKDSLLVRQLSRTQLKKRKIKINVAILGGGDLVMPLILAGVVLQTLGLWQALLVSLGATIALGALFYYSEKGKFYPAMPFITAGCFIALGIVYLINLI